jgi:hypothetical protein
MDLSPIDRLLAIEDIKLLKARYCRHVDEQDWEAYRALFLADAHLEYGSGVFDSADEMVDFFRDLLRGGSSVHHCHTPEIELTGPAEATGTWALFDRVVLREGAAETSWSGYARYWETYQRVDGQWKIATLRVERFHRLPLE